MSNGATAATVVAARINKYIRRLREKGATSPEKAVTLEDIHMRRSLIFRRLVKREVIVRKGEDKYWLNLQNLESYRKSRRKVVAFFLLLLLLMILIVAILQMGNK